MLTLARERYGGPCSHPVKLSWCRPTKHYFWEQNLPCWPLVGEVNIVTVCIGYAEGRQYASRCLVVFAQAANRYCNVVLIV